MREVLELRPAPGQRRELGNSRPQEIAALLTRMAPELQRRHPGCHAWQAVLNAEGRPVDFMPSPYCPVYGARGRSGTARKRLAQCFAIQADADARYRRLTVRPGRKTLAECVAIQARADARQRARWN